MEGNIIQIFVRFSRQHVSARVFVLVLVIHVKLVLHELVLQRLPQISSVLNFGHAMKVFRVGDPQCLHPGGVLLFGKVHLKVAPTPVRFSTADFAIVVVIEAVQFEEPVGNRFSVPVQRHIFGIVNGCIVVSNLWHVDDHHRLWQNGLQVVAECSSTNVLRTATIN